MIYKYMGISFVYGILAAKAFEQLPPKWFCDYGEAVCQIHSKGNRHLNAKKVLLFGAACAIIQGAFVCFSASADWFVNASVGITVPVLLLIALSDIKYSIIPNELLFCAALFGAPYAFSNGYIQPLAGALVGGSALFAVFFIATKLLKKEAMGFGDVLLSALGGFLCGAKGYIIVLFAAVFSAALVFSILLIMKKINKNEPQPFGPFLVVGIVLTVCFWQFWQGLLQTYYYI